MFRGNERTGLLKVRLEASFRSVPMWLAISSPDVCFVAAIAVVVHLACTGQSQPGRTGDSGCLLLLPLLMRRQRGD